MKFVIFVRMAALACVAAIAAAQACACKCGAIHGTNLWEIAKLEEKSSSVIFKGTPERLELQWNRPTTGELIPATDIGGRPDGGPRMLITFRVQRAYKGGLRPEVQLKTGLGGGDCGAQFDTGLTYLVYAYTSTHGELEVNMCSPGGQIGSSRIATNLRYLRKEQPTAKDLAPPRRLSAEESAREYVRLEDQRQRDWEDRQRKYVAVTGQICGMIILEKGKKEDAGIVSFLPTTGYSPIDHPMANVNPDGSFCSERLRSGEYYLYFTRRSDGGVTSAVFYPGVSDHYQATAVGIGAGQTRLNLLFKIPVQKMYSVRGIISADDKSGIDSRGVSVILDRFDADSYPL